jgi:hypothetical protein
MTVVSSCGGVIGTEERSKTKSGYTFAKLSWQLKHEACLAQGAAMRTSLPFSVIFMPGWSRKNRISEAGSLEEYTPLT